MVKKRMNTKSKTYTVLEKKLEEIECLLGDFGLSDRDLNRAYREIELRFIFTQTLLAAEISSVNEGEEEEWMKKLRCMVKKLAELEKNFLKLLTGPINEPDMQSGGVVDETGSVFSLVESLQEEFRDGSLEEKVVGRETDEIKKNRFKDLVVLPPKDSLVATHSRATFVFIH
ncbi:hypothetical protein AALP_AA8G454700 [Arabis alpina]|uniref:DUF7610 domain-containing protein n=1 Tax=Arabis alpina TaxID=50452 RepID=A0A087GDL4_ARAAL|nr:hypothetical protein AALP_AA8G454700 [Arabis alpina]